MNMEGSIDNRVRFPLEVIDTVVETISAERTAVCISHGLNIRVRRTHLPFLELLMQLRHGYERSAPDFHNID